jgi:hypothetical protein
MFCWIRVSGSSVGIESHLRSIGIRTALNWFQSRDPSTVNTMRSSALIKLSAHCRHCASGIPYKLQCKSMERIHSLTSVYGGRYVWRFHSLRIALIARSDNRYDMLWRKRKRRATHARQARGSTYSRKCCAGAIQHVTMGMAENLQSVLGFVWTKDMNAAFTIRTSFQVQLSYQ